MLDFNLGRFRFFNFQYWGFLFFTFHVEIKKKRITRVEVNPYVPPPKPEPLPTYVEIHKQLQKSINALDNMLGTNTARALEVKQPLKSCLTLPEKQKSPLSKGRVTFSPTTPVRTFEREPEEYDFLPTKQEIKKMFKRRNKSNHKRTSFFASAKLFMRNIFSSKKQDAIVFKEKPILSEQLAKEVPRPLEYFSLPTSAKQTVEDQVTPFEKRHFIPKAPPKDAPSFTAHIKRQHRRDNPRPVSAPIKKKKVVALPSTSSSSSDEYAIPFII